MSFDRLASPWVLIALLVVPIAAWALRGRRRRSVVTYPLTGAMAVSGWSSLRSRVRVIPALLRLAALVFLVIALARPQDISGEVRTSTEGIAMQLVIDRSGSMEDVVSFEGRPVTMLEGVKQIVKAFVTGEDGLAGRSGDLIGVIAYGTIADTICPLVRSHEAVATLIEQIEIPQARNLRHTAIGEALALATARLAQADEMLRDQAQSEAGEEQPNDDASAEPEFSIKSKVIILLTDGENTVPNIRPMDAATMAAERGIRVYTIGIAGAPDMFGRIGLDERLLRAIAQKTDGRYFRVESLDNLRDVYEVIGRLETTEIATTEYTHVEERFMPWVTLAAALVLLEFLLSSTVLRRLP